MLASVSTNIGIFDVDADADKNADAVWGLCWCKFHFFHFVFSCLSASRRRTFFAELPMRCERRERERERERERT